MGKTKTYSSKALRAVFACVLATLLACVAGAAFPARAAYGVDAAGSITITFTGSDTSAPIVGMESRAYKVASFLANPEEMRLDAGYDELANILGWQNAQAATEQDALWWQQQARTMDCYVRTSTAFVPYARGTTDANGTVVFNNLEEGMYLVLNAGDGVHRFSSSLVLIGGNKAFEQVVEPKNVTPAAPYESIKVVKHWMADTEADRPASIRVQLVQGDNFYGDPVELSDANGWTYTWDKLDASQVYYWDVIELDPVDNYMIFTDEDDGNFTITNSLLPFPPFNPNKSLSISKQEVGGGPELPGATLQVINEAGSTVEEFVSTTEPTSFVLDPGTYTLREIAPPSGYGVAEDMAFRLGEDGAVECLQDGAWVDVAGTVVMYDAPLGEEEPPAPTPPTPTPPASQPPTPSTPATPVTGKLPQTGQLWWPVPVLLAAGIVAIGLGRVISVRSK